MENNDSNIEDDNHVNSETSHTSDDSLTDHGDEVTRNAITEQAAQS